MFLLFNTETVNLYNSVSPECIIHVLAANYIPVVRGHTFEGVKFPANSSKALDCSPVKIVRH